MGKDYSVCIKVSPEMYDKYRNRLNNKGISTYGGNSKVSLVNRSVFEWALDEMSEATLNKILEDLK